MATAFMLSKLTAREARATLNTSIVCSLPRGSSSVVERLPSKPPELWLETFISSRLGERGLTPKGEEWLRTRLGRFFFSHPHPLLITRTEIERFLSQFPTPFNRHSHFRAIRAFYNWLEAQGHVALSPCHRMAAPRLPTVLLAHPTPAQVSVLITEAGSTRDKAIISLFADTGLRVSELASITSDRIDWQARIIKVIGKGRKERQVKFGVATAQLLSNLPPTSSGNIWGIDFRGIQLMLLRLSKRTGIKANAHSFRRFFAIELRKRGVDSQTIQYLGGWESLAMVERYSRAAKQEVALAEYIPLADSLRPTGASTSQVSPAT